jgi:hypothetical protein
MNKYRVRGLACFAAFMLAIAGFMTVLFSIQAGVLDWRAYATADVLGVTSLIIFVGFAVGVFGTMHMFKRSMAKAVETLDTQKLSTS